MLRLALPFSVLAVAFAVVVAPGVPAGAGAQEATQAAARCPSPFATPAALPAAVPGGESVCVAVLVGDYYVRPRQAAYRVGLPYVFAVGNQGREVHEFVIERAGAVDEPLEANDHEAEAEDTAPGGRAELAWTFTAPGRYRFACHRPGHFEEGMTIEVDVTA